ncbi:MAG: HupE/UreJ family protein [Chthoniobacteraceae bacterium]
MSALRWLGVLLLALLASASAHDEPTSFLDLRLGADGITASLAASTTDLAHDLPAIEPAMLLDPAVAASQRDALSEIVRARLHIAADGMPLIAELRAVIPAPGKRDVHLEIHYAWLAAPTVLQVQCRLFPYDPRHRTFVNFYEGARLQRQEIFQGVAAPVEFRPGSRQSIGTVVRQFVFSGVHHIFIGPDHILFVVGLLLLGGGARLLLKIVTAFTVAHSITLGLATFGLVRPPAAIIEPAIALSIVFVGLHAFFGKERRDPRLIFAFCFGLIHGFGFANVLQEMVLPRHALGWSLLAFNGGVEIGQTCIVTVVAPLLAFARRRSPLAADRIAATAALGVTAAGAFWFFQRVLP